MPRKPTTRAFVSVRERLRPISPPKKFTSQSRTKPRAVLSSSLKIKRIGLAIMRRITITPKTIAEIVITRESVSMLCSFHRQELDRVLVPIRDILCCGQLSAERERKRAPGDVCHTCRYRDNSKNGKCQVEGAFPGRASFWPVCFFAFFGKREGLAMQKGICYTK